MNVRYPARFASRTIAIAPWPERVVSRVKLSRSTSNRLHRRIASRAAGMAELAGFSKSMRRAIASGSTRFALPSNQIFDVSVLLPDPLGPAIRDSVGILLGGD